MAQSSMIPFASLPANTSSLPRWIKRAGLLLSIAILGLAVYSLIRLLRGLSFEEIGRAMQVTSPQRLLLCGLLTGVSFAVMGCYDILAVRFVTRLSISPYRAWFAGVLANAISNTLGFHAATATAVRYRILSKSGLNGPKAAAVTAYSWTTLAFGFASVLAIAMTVSPLASEWQQAGSLALLGALLLLARWLGPGKRIALGGREFRLPSGMSALGQMVLGAVEMGSAIGALYILLPPGQAGSFAEFSALYIGAVLLGIASHAPGGLGVFEATMLALSSGHDRAATLAALLLYRVIYNLGPFVLAALAFAGEEILAAVNSRADRG
jgi:phosphatidylglycerol lysyltransferase